MGEEGMMKLVKGGGSAEKILCYKIISQYRGAYVQ
jgi:hypothetical protein